MDVVKDFKIYKGGFLVEYGGCFFFVIDVKLKDGNNQKFVGFGGLGFIFFCLILEGLIQKDKFSFIVFGCCIYVDLLIWQVNCVNEGNEDFLFILDYFFYDLNVKVNFQLSDKDCFFLSGYFGWDVFGFSSDFFNFDFDWGNVIGMVCWNYVFNFKLFVNIIFIYLDYQYNINN